MFDDGDDDDETAAAAEEEEEGVEERCFEDEVEIDLDCGSRRLAVAVLMTLMPPSL